MNDLTRSNKENSTENTTHIGEFSRKSFLQTIGNTLYQGLKPSDYRGMYERAYRAFKHNQEKPFKVEPEPLPPEMIEGEITLDRLSEVEVSLAIMYAGGFSLLSNLLGKDPKEEIMKYRAEKLPE